MTVGVVEDNSTIILRISDAIGSGSNLRSVTGDIQLTARVVGTALTISAPALVAATRAFTVLVGFTDAAGNADVDRIFNLDDTGSNVTINQGSAQAMGTVAAISGVSAASVTIDTGLSGETFTLTATHPGGDCWHDAECHIWGNRDRHRGRCHGGDGAGGDRAGGNLYRHGGVQRQFG